MRNAVSARSCTSSKQTEQIALISGSTLICDKASNAMIMGGVALDNKVTKTSNKQPIMMIKAESLKLVQHDKQDGKIRLGAGTGSQYQLMNLVKDNHQNSLNVIGPEHKKSLKIATRPRKIQFGKIKNSVSSTTPQQIAKLVTSKSQQQQQINSITVDQQQQEQTLDSSTKKNISSFNLEQPLQESHYPQVMMVDHRDSSRDMQLQQISSIHNMEESKMNMNRRMSNEDMIDLENSNDDSGMLSTVGKCVKTKNKDSSNFNDIEEKGQQESMLIGPEPQNMSNSKDWFKTQTGDDVARTQTPLKNTKNSESVDSQQDDRTDEQIFHAAKTTTSRVGKNTATSRGMPTASSTEFKRANKQQGRPLKLMRSLEVAPLIKRVPESSGIIGHKSKKQPVVIGAKQQQLMIAGENSNFTSQASERMSELTDDQMLTGLNNVPILASLESLRSNESQTSLKNVFSQSQKLTDIATRYINIQDETGDKESNNNNVLERVKSKSKVSGGHDINFSGAEAPSSRQQRVHGIQQLVMAQQHQDREKGTPRFNRVSKGLKQKISLRKKKSHEGGQFTYTRESFNQDKGSTVFRQMNSGGLGKSSAILKSNQDHHHQKLKIGIRSLKTPEDQLSGNQDENSISSLTQQKDMKSLMGILKKHEQQKLSGIRTIQSNSSVSHHNQLQQKQKPSSSKITLTKLSENLYTVAGSSSGHNQMQQLNQSAGGQNHPLTPNGNGAATFRDKGFGSGNSQQSRSFNVGTGIIQSQQSKKKLQIAKQSAVTQWRQQNGGIIKKIIKQNNTGKMTTTTTQQSLQATQREKGTSSQQSQGNNGGAQSHRERSNFQILVPYSSSSNVVLHPPQSDMTIVTSPPTVNDQNQKRKSNDKDQQQPPLKQSLRQKNKGESHRQRLFQKQMSQTIKLNSISSGISPKASGDMPLDFSEQQKGRDNLKRNITGTLSSSTKDKKSSKVIKLPAQSTANLGSISNRVLPAKIKPSLKQEPSEVKDSFIHIGEEEDIATERLATTQKVKDNALNNRRVNKSPSQHRVRDPSPRIYQKHLEDDEINGPIPSARESNHISLLSSSNKMKKIESIKQAIRDQKSQNREKTTKQPASLMGLLMHKKLSSSPPSAPLDDTNQLTGRDHLQQRNAVNYQSDGQPFQLFQSRGGSQPFQVNEESATIEDDEDYDQEIEEVKGGIEDDDEDADEDNMSEMMQTIMQSTQKSITHPVAHFNIDHPTQQTHGLTMMKRAAALNIGNSNQQAGAFHNNSPGDRLENAYQVSYQHMRSRQNATNNISGGIQEAYSDPVSAYTNQQLDQDDQQQSLKKYQISKNIKIPKAQTALDSVQTYQMLSVQPQNNTESNFLLRAESIQSMSNVVDLERDPPQINRIQRGTGVPPFINNSVQMRNNKLKFNQQQQQQQSRNQQQKQFAYTNQSQSKSQTQKQVRRNIFVAMIEDGVLSVVMKYLPIRRVLPLKSVLLAQYIVKNHPNLQTLFEKEFLRYLNFYRCRDPNMGGKRSLLCRLITMYYLSTLEVTQKQDEIFHKIQYKLKFGRATIRNCTETGIPFEIEKDVDRTFIDKTKFTETHRLGLSIVLRSIAELQKDVGYVQGLNFIIGNLLMMMEHRDSIQAQKATLAAFFTFMKQLDMKEFYTEKMLGLKEAMFKLECLLYNEMPEIYLYLMEQSITVEYFASQWFLTLFQYDIEDVEQSAIIMLVSMLFGQKVIFQIAFQLILSIRSKLCCMSFEQALIYLKDFAGEPQYRRTSFIQEALKNDRITNDLLEELSRIYQKMCDKNLNKAPHTNQTPMATRVKFLRGTHPSKVNIKVIWGSASQQDLLSSSNSMASIQGFHVISKQQSKNKTNQKQLPQLQKIRDQSEIINDFEDDDGESAPVIIEDISEVIHSNRINDLSQKMSGIINQSIERKKKGIQGTTPGNQIQRTFLEPSKTVVDDLMMNTASSKKNKEASFKRHYGENHHNALLQNPLAYENRPTTMQQAPSINPFDIGGADSLVLEEINPTKVRQEQAAILLHSVSIDNSIELMEPTAANEEAVASEDVDADDSNSRHFFGNNKELFEHTQKKHHQTGNLHGYQQQSAYELSRQNQQQGIVNSQKYSPTRARGISYKRYYQAQEQPPSMGNEQIVVPQQLLIKNQGHVSLVNHTNLHQRAGRGNAHGSPILAPCSSSEDEYSQAAVQPQRLDTDPDHTPKMKHSPVSQLSTADQQSLPQHRRANAGAAKGGSLSPNKQKIDSSSGFSNFFFKLNPFAMRDGAAAAQKQQNSIDHSSEESARAYNETTNEDFGENIGQIEAHPKTSYRARRINYNNQEEKQVEEDLNNIKREPQQRGTREPPMFMSPLTAYRQYQKQQLHQQNNPATATTSQSRNNSTVNYQKYHHHHQQHHQMSQDYTVSSSHRSPMAFQPASLKQPSSGRHRKTTTVTGEFNSRQMHFPGEPTETSYQKFINNQNLITGDQQQQEQQQQLFTAAKHNNISNKKPSHRQKQKFADNFNLEKLNLSSQQNNGSGRVSQVRNQNNNSSRRDAETLQQIQQQPLLQQQKFDIFKQPSENIPESEQKEQKVNNISLYGSNNVQLTKKRPENNNNQQTGVIFNQFVGEPAIVSYDDDNSDEDDRNYSPVNENQQMTSAAKNTPLLDQLQNSGATVEWDEEDMIIRSDRLPSIPVTKQTGLLTRKQQLKQQQQQLYLQASTNSTSKQLMKERMINQFKMATKKIEDRPFISYEDNVKNQVDDAGAQQTNYLLRQDSATIQGPHSSLMKQPNSQEDIRHNNIRSTAKQSVTQRFQQELLQSKDKKLMVQLNQSLEETKNVGSNHGNNITNNTKGRLLGTLLAYNINQRQSSKNHHHHQEMDGSSSCERMVPRDHRKSSQKHQESRTHSQNVSGTRQQVLKESRSHDRVTMLSRLTASNKLLNGQQNVIPSAFEDIKRQQKIFIDQHLYHQENLHDFDDGENLNLADGRIPQANISSYNSHQSNKKLAFQSQAAQKYPAYASTGSNMLNTNTNNSHNNNHQLEETCIVSNSNNPVIFRDDLRHSSKYMLTTNTGDTQKAQNQISQWDFARTGQQQNNDISISSSGKNSPRIAWKYAGKTSVQRQSLQQVQGHKGDRHHEAF